MKRSLLWFRNDLRIHDNEALIKAAQEILRVYSFDLRHFGDKIFWPSGIQGKNRDWDLNETIFK